MAELNEDQFQHALQVLNRDQPEGTAINREKIVEAAVFLQFPLAEVTDEEEFFAVQQMRSSVPMIEILRNFIRQRNHTLLPAPIDPRRQKILDILVAKGPDTPAGYEKAVDEILAVLGERGGTE